MNTPAKLSMKILMIEDNPDEAELIQAMLSSIKNVNFKIVHEETLQRGIEHLSIHDTGDSRIDVVLLDLHLPDSVGFESYKRLSSKAPWVPVILMTNLDDEDLALRLVRNGAQDYLLKTELDCNLLDRAIRYAIERKKVEEALRESEERYMLAIKGANDGLWDWDIISDRVYFSPRWKEMLLYQPDEIGDHPTEWLSRIHPDDVENVQSALDKHLKGFSDHFECEHRLKRKDGVDIWVLVRGLAVQDERGNSYRMAGSLTDISLQKTTEEKLLYGAYHDSLTGLPNRALFTDRLNHCIERAKRHQKYQFCVLFIDLDRFKLINDSLGHTYGDQLLSKVADSLASCLRTIDSAARIGGDEFAILLEDVKETTDATLVAERVQQAIQNPIQLNGHRVVISASIGIIFSDSRYKIPEDLLRDADIAMYNAKVKGKACFSIFQPTMHKRAIMRMELENELREVLSNEETCHKNLAVLFQPIVAINSGQILGFEALVRWNHPERGLILPNEFIPMAEETDLIHPLGLWVLKESCKQVRKWQDLEKDSLDAPHLSVSVNISGRQFTRPDIVESIENTIQECGITPSCLCLEITERIFLENDKLIIKSLERLRDLGVMLQIDDFGRGYSSFSYLQHFPVSTLKIDSLFIQRLGKCDNNAEIIRSIVGLAKSLGLSVIAEGVESDYQYQELKQLDCQFVQGYFISKEISSEEAMELIARNLQLARAI